MIKRYTNKQGLSIDSTYVAQGVSSPKGTDEDYLGIGNNQEVLMRFNNLDLDNKEKIGRVILRLIVSQDTSIFENPTEKSTYYVKRNIGTYTPASVVWSNKPATSQVVEGGMLVPYKQVPAGWMPQDPSQFPYKLIELDITSIVKYWKANPSQPKTITISKSGLPAVILNPSKIKFTKIEEYVLLEEVKESGIDSMFSHTPVDCGFAGKGYINDLTGELVVQTMQMASSSKKAPINFSAFRINKDLTGYGHTSLLGGKFRANFEYAITRDDNYAYLVDPNGKEMVFTKMESEEAEKYGIETNASEVYVDLSTYAYATYSGTQITLKYPDETELEFDLHHLKKITVPSGDTITYQWDSSFEKLLHIENSDGDRVEFSYYSNGKIKEVEFVEERRIISISYNTSLTEIDEISLIKWVYDPSTSDGSKIFTELEKATYQKSSYTFSLQDLKNDGRFEFYLNNEKVTKAVEKKRTTNSIINQVRFTRDTEKTMIENFYGHKQYIYFDGYGQVTHKLDEDGKSIKAEYDLVGKDGTSRRVTSNTNVYPNRDNLIFDFSFDNQVGEYGTSTKGWQKNSNTNNVVKSVDSGVYGQKCLMVRKTGLGATHITQSIDVSPGSYSFIGFEKRDGISGNPKIKANITYTILRLAQGPETGIVDDSGNVWVSDTVNTSVSTPSLTGTTEKWNKFELLNIIIPTGATNASIELDIYASHSVGDLFVDDFQLIKDEHGVNYNLIPNGYFESVSGSLPDKWLGDSLEGTDRLTSINVATPYNKFMKTTSMKIVGDFTQVKELYQTIDVNGKEGDEFVFSGWFKGLLSKNEDARITIELIGQSTPQIFDIDIQKNIEGWKNVSRGFVAKNNFDQVKVTVAYRGFNTIYFNSLQLFNQSKESYYSYDDLGNIMDQSTNTSSSEAIKNKKGKVLQTSNKQGETYRYTYDADGELGEVKDNKGNKVTHSYDSKGNPVSMEVNSPLGIISHSKVYNSKNQVLKSTDEFGRETINVYDDEFRHIQTTDPLGYKDINEYNEYNQLTKIIREKDSNENESIEYEYDGSRNLKKIIMSPSKYYEFFYDQFNRVEKINLNAKTIVKYSYNNKHQILTQTYGDSINSDYYTFTYDEKDRVETVKLNDDTNSLCKYVYDELDRISEVHYKNNVVYYSYDRQGKLIRKTDLDGIEERYIYDNIDTVQKGIFNINGLIRSYEYIKPYETSQYNLDGFIDRIDKAFNDDHVTLLKDTRGQTGINPSFTYSYDLLDDEQLNKPIMHLNSPGGQANYNLDQANARRLTNKIDGSKYDHDHWKNKFAKKKTAFGWFHFEENRSMYQDIMVFGIPHFNEWINLVLTTNDTIKIVSNGQSYEFPNTTYQYVHSNWTFISYQIETAGNDIKIRVYIDGTMLPEQTFSLTYDGLALNVSDFTMLGLGTFNSRGYEHEVIISPYKIAHLSVGAYDYTQDDFDKLYNMAIPYFNNPVIRKQRSGIIFHDNQAYDDLDVVTLKGSLVSNQGVQPTDIGYQAETYKLDKTRLFEYDEERKTHVYASYNNDKDLIPMKSKLAYDLNLKDTGTISIRFKPKETSQLLRTILSLRKSGQTYLGLYLNSSNQLVIKQSQEETTDQTAIHDGWNQLIVRWNDSFVFIHLNGNSTIIKAKVLNYNEALLDVGYTLDTEPTKHLNGQLEMLAYTDEVIDTSKRNLIRNSYQTISYESEYDILGRKEKEELTIGNTKRSIDFTYRRPDNDPNKTSFEINQVSTLTNQNIDYVYDDLGNVKLIQTLDGIYEYEYDFLGRLVEEYNPVLNQTIKITYDDQNIAYKKYYAGQSSTLVKQMEFLTNNEDQLLYLGITENGNETPLSISYDPKYIGNPTQIGNKSLVWEGRRLKEISSDNIEYTYNEQGIRTSKDVDGVITKYYLRDKDILAEETGGVKTVFIYNDENELIGFEYQGNYYFYEKDLLGNISNIIDTNGTIMVTYKYDAWGNWINKTSASNGTSLGNTLLLVNPFIYKGYYYDKETDWYYLKSRYYCPKISRFINMDSTNYLQPGQVDGINLFAYCGNDPVLGYDPNGNFSFKKLWRSIKKGAKKIVNKIVNHFLDKIKPKIDYGFGFFETQFNVGEIDKLWDASCEGGVCTINMPSILNLLGVRSTTNFSLGLTSEDGLYFGYGHSYETANGVVTTTWGHRIVPYAFAYATIESYNYIKEKVKNVDWGVIGRSVWQGVKVVALSALIAGAVWGLIAVAPFALPVLAKVAAPVLASFLVYLNL